MMTGISEEAQKDISYPPKLLQIYPGIILIPYLRFIRQKNSWYSTYVTDSFKQLFADSLPMYAHQACKNIYMDS